MAVFQASQLYKANNSKILLVSVLCAFLSQPLSSTVALSQQASRGGSQTQITVARDKIARLHTQMQTNKHGKEPLVLLNGIHTGNNPYLRAQLDLEKRFGKEISEGYGYTSEREPTFPEIKFFKAEEQTTLSGRIDELLHGITVALPPEYDLYGYELRRYMQAVAGPQVLGDKKRIASEIANTKRAKIILEYWGKELNKEIKALKAEIDADPSVDPTTRTTFKFNSGKARAFMVEANSWVDNNRRMLEMLFEITDRYQYSEPAINFGSQKDLNQFLNLFRTRQKALEIVHAYPPFRMMIY